MATAFQHGVTIVETTQGVRSIRTVNSGIIGIVGTAPDADEDQFPLDTPVLLAGNQIKAALLDTTGDSAGTLPQSMKAIFDQIGAMVVVVRVAEDAGDPDNQNSLVIGGADPNGQFTGLQALLSAESVVGVKPRIIGAPGFDVVPAVATELATIAESLRGFTYMGMDANTPSEAITYRGTIGSRRVMLLWPELMAYDTGSDANIMAPASAYALGLRAKLDNMVGWHKSISNQVINGLTGIYRSVDFDLGNPNTTANLLNENEITTAIVRDGYRFWGNRTCAADPIWAFEVAVRTNDIIADSIAAAQLWAIDKPMSRSLIDEIVKSVNARLRLWTAQGFLLGGSAWLDSDINTSEEISAGRLTISYDFTPVPPLENLIFNQTITDSYTLTGLNLAA